MSYYLKKHIFLNQSKKYLLRVFHIRKAVKILKGEQYESSSFFSFIRSTMPCGTPHRLHPSPSFCLSLINSKLSCTFRQPLDIFQPGKTIIRKEVYVKFTLKFLIEIYFIWVEQFGIGRCLCNSHSPWMNSKSLMGPHTLINSKD